jgi:hypothetical protein
MTLSPQETAVLTSRAAGKGALLLDTNTTNNTESDFDASATAPTDPTGGKVLDVQDPGFLYLQQFGTDAADETCKAIVTGFKQLGTGWSAGSQVALITSTLGSAPTGAATVTPNGASDLFADTMANTGGQSNVKEYNDTTGNKSAAHVRIDCRCFDKVAVQLLDNGSSASTNAIYWWGN